MPTVVPPVRLEFLASQSAQVSGLSGAVAEVGVYQGGTAKLLCVANPDRTVHLFDTFEGLPALGYVDGVDGLPVGKFADTSEAEVRAFLEPCTNYELYVGLFPDTSEPVAELEFVLVHIDVDLYASTKAALEFFWPRLVTGGVVVLDDYNHPRCRGANDAVDEFFGALGIPVVSRGKDGQDGTRIVKHEVE